jgi:hypothetical protein
LKISRGVVKGRVPLKMVPSVLQAVARLQSKLTHSVLIVSKRNVSAVIAIDGLALLGGWTISGVGRPRPKASVLRAGCWASY